MPVETESLIEYPCDFPIKVLGRTQAGFAQAVLGIVRTHVPDFDGSTARMVATFLPCGPGHQRLRCPGPSRTGYGRAS